MARFESTTLARNILRFFPVEGGAARRRRRRAVPSTPSSTLPTMETAEQLPAAETHLTITQSSYVTQSQSKHAQHTHREGASVTHSPTKGVWREMPNRKQKNVQRVRTFRGLRMKWWMRHILGETGFHQGNNEKQLRKVKKIKMSKQEHARNIILIIKRVCVRAPPEQYPQVLVCVECRQEVRDSFCAERFFSRTPSSPSETRAINQTVRLQLIFDPEALQSLSTQSLHFLPTPTNPPVYLFNCLCVSVIITIL